MKRLIADNSFLLHSQQQCNGWASTGKQLACSLDDEVSIDNEPNIISWCAQRVSEMSFTQELMQRSCLFGLAGMLSIYTVSSAANAQSATPYPMPQPVGSVYSAGSSYPPPEDASEAPLFSGNAQPGRSGLRSRPRSRPQATAPRQRPSQRPPVAATPAPSQRLELTIRPQQRVPAILAPVAASSVTIPASPAQAPRRPSYRYASPPTTNYARQPMPSAPATPAYEMSVRNAPAPQTTQPQPPVATMAESVTAPIAPPAYRPQPQPQPQIQVMQPAPAAQPVYIPQPVQPERMAVYEADPEEEGTFSWFYDWFESDETQPEMTPPAQPATPPFTQPAYATPTYSAAEPDRFASDYAMREYQPALPAATDIAQEQQIPVFESYDASTGVVTMAAPEPVFSDPVVAASTPIVIADQPNQPMQVEAQPMQVEAFPSVVGASDHSVTYYDATASGSAPSFDSEVEEVAEPARALSTKTQAILSQLPDDLSPTKRSIKGGFDIDRADISEELPTGEVFASDEIGANMVVRKRNIDVNYELEKAYNALLQGNTEASVAIYQNILTVEPNNTFALFGLATTYHRLNMLDEARDMYGRLLAIDPYNPEALNNFLGLVGEEAPESAIAYLEQLKGRNPEFSPIYAQLAQIYSQQGNHPQAIINMQQATTISPENLIYKYNLAILYDRLGDARRASVLYRQLLKAGLTGKEIPASLEDIQERLIFLAAS